MASHRNLPTETKGRMSDQLTLDLERILDGYLGLHEDRGRSHYQAAKVCLDYHQHESSLLCEIKDLEGIIDTVHMQWAGEISQQIRDTWDDLEQATEWGAEGVAVVVVLDFTKYTIRRRAKSKRRIGFDYWLSEKNPDANSANDDSENVLLGTARLEVSGILEAASESTITTRVKDKIKQTTQSDDYGIPAYVVVVEWSKPVVYLIERTLNS